MPDLCVCALAHRDDSQRVQAARMLAACLLMECMRLPGTQGGAKQQLVEGEKRMAGGCLERDVDALHLRVVPAENRREQATERRRKRVRHARAVLLLLPARYCCCYAVLGLT